ncbi:MAG: LamG domain-containing protein [Planctomycetota bacterium]|jgi:hypothetical protein
MLMKHTCLAALVLALVSITPAVSNGADPSLVGWWKFDETSGTIASDSSGNGHDGTFVGSPQWVGGYFGGALQFTGSPDMVTVPYSAQLNPENQFTVMLWANVEPGGTGWRAPISSRVPGYNLYAPAAGTGSGTWEFWVGLNPGWAQARPGPAIQEGEWIHMAAVYDNGNMKLYGNGELGPERSGAMVPNTENELRIGAGGPPSGALHHFVGKIDDVRIYDRVLSVEEILLAMEGSGEEYPYALNPNPANGTLLEATWANLGWRAGDSAVSHDVYLGDNFDDVNDGVGDSFQGNQTGTSVVVGFPGYPVPGGLIPGTTYYWRVDEVNEADPNSPWRGGVWSFTVPPKEAYDPSLADGAVNVLQNVTLSWTAGFGAKLHNVYFGDNLDDVSSAEGALSQSETTYAPGALEMEKTYYWRVDEFDGVVTHRGDVWSFTTVPDVAVTDPNLTLWWTLDEGEGATAVDWSGHENHGAIVGDAQWVDGYHGTALTFGGDIYVETSAYQGVTGTAPRTCCAWIRTVTAGSRNIMSWGQNSAGQKWRMLVLGTGGLRIEVNGGYHYGVTDVADGRWHHVAVTFEDDGSPDVVDTLLYVDGQRDATAASAEEPINTGSGPVRIGESPWHNAPFMDQIDDARIYAKVLTQEEIMLVMRGDPLQAWSPSPANRSTPDIDNATPLSFSPGDMASQHDVYFGTDKNAVDGADSSDATGIYRGNQSGTSFTPAEGVEWGGGPYYWRIDENNTDGTVTTGRVWSFTVADFILVDDFESYTDDDAAGEAIWQHWIDGFDAPANGSQVGNLLPPYAEQTIVRGGLQSMPLIYDNTAGVTNSEAHLPLAAPRDWTKHGVGVLSLWFRGYPPSVGGFTAGPGGTFTLNAAGTDISGTADEFHFAYKTLTGPGTMIARVDSLVDTDPWARAGVMIRETLDAGSKHAFVCVTPGNGVVSQGRTDTGTASFSTNQTGITAPHWVRLERDAGGNFTASHSTNGSTWQPVGSAIPTNVPMVSNVYVGLAVTSHDSAEATEARFSNVTITGSVSTQWEHRDIGILGNDAEPLYVAVSSSMGAPAVVINDDANAAVIDVWTQWTINLSRFADQGVNLTDIDKIAIGLGTAGSAAATGGSGTVFIDDITLLRPAQ